VSDFQLILLSEVARPAREARIPGAFSLIPFHGRTGARMSSPDSAEYKISEEDIAAWYTPREALAYAIRAVGKESAVNAVWQRLVGGLIEAAAASFSSIMRDRAPQPHTKPSLVPSRFWKRYSKSGSDFWAGDARFFIPGSRPEYSTTYHYFGIRLNPDQVRSSLPPLPPEPATPVKKQTTAEKPSEPPKVEEPEPEQKGPPVSEEHLKAWFALYRQVYSGPAETEAIAVASARGMFQGKSVSRDRIRALRGSQKRGRKTAEPAK
jgi:hypothetical protein